MQIPSRFIDELKSSGHYFAAGALQASMNLGRGYGCHFGMRSELDHARAEFYRGFDAAEILK